MFVNITAKIKDNGAMEIPVRVVKFPKGVHVKFYGLYFQTSEFPTLH